ncbi:hypothetical protein BAE44_0024005, partial [Dichanthelium oligosanthes]
LGEPSTSCDDTGSSSDDSDGVATGSRSRGKSSPWSVWERRKDRIRQSLRPKRVNSKVEHAARVNGQGSGRWHHHSTGPRRMEVSSVRGHGHGSAVRGLSHMHHRT